MPLDPVVARLVEEAFAGTVCRVCRRPGERMYAGNFYCGGCYPKSARRRADAGYRVPVVADPKLGTVFRSRHTDG